MHTLPEKIEEAKAFLANRISSQPDIGIILGTGLGPLARALEVEAEVAFGEIPHFMQPTAEFHDGKLVIGRLSGRTVAVMQGRFHSYEGYTLEQVSFPVRILKALGAGGLIVSNIAGGLNPLFQKGDIMAITDHINLLGGNPLIGKNHDALGPRFPDMWDAYSRNLLEKLMRIALLNGIALQKGVYACMSGPSLETAAEYRMLRIIGADAVGMSTVPEVIVAVHAGMKVLGLSLITDLCLPDHLQPINIPEILDLAAQAEPRLASLIAEMVKVM